MRSKKHTFRFTQNNHISFYQSGAFRFAGLIMVRDMMTPAIIMIILKLGMRRAMKRGMMMGIMKVQVNLRRKTKISKKMNRFKYSLRFSFASFLWSPARSKRKKRSHANFSLRGFCYYLGGYFCTFIILSIRL